MNTNATNNMIASIAAAQKPEKKSLDLIKGYKFGTVTLQDIVSHPDDIRPLDSFCRFLTGKYNESTASGEESPFAPLFGMRNNSPDQLRNFTKKATDLVKAGEIQEDSFWVNTVVAAKLYFNKKYGKAA